jgi:hypothetical protein
MKIKNVLFLIMMILSMARGKAQCQKTNTQFLEVVAGVGVIPTFVKDQLHTDLPPIFAGLDYRINERFSIGSRIGITKVTSASDLLGDGAYEQFRNRFVMAGVRFSVHSRYFEHWDLYGGMNFAYTVSKVEVIKGNVALLKKHLNFRKVSGKFMSSAFIGAKFLLKPKTALFGEIGYGISLLNLGLTRKI